MLIIFTFLLIISHCFGFSNKPIVSHIKGFPKTKLDDIEVVEPYYTSKKNTSCMIFFTGGSSFIPGRIYNDFFNELANNQISIYTPSFKYKNIDLLIDSLSKEYKEVIISGHSSGCTTALNNCQNKNIKKLILFDGVDTRFLNIKKNTSLKYCKSILFLNAGKSYRITNDPPGFPFIPFLDLNYKNIKTDEKSMKLCIEATNYGHSDILNYNLGNFMHRIRLSVGNKNRSKANIKNYHQWAGQVIKKYINREYRDMNRLNSVNNTIYKYFCDNQKL